MLNNPPSPVSLLLPFYCFPLTDYTLVWVAWYYYFPDKFPKVLLMLHLTFSLKRLILLCFIRFAPSGLRTRPEHKCPTIQRTLPHLKGWNLLNLIAWTEPAILFLSMNFYLNGSPSRQRTLPISIKNTRTFGPALTYSVRVIDIMSLCVFGIWAGITVISIYKYIVKSKRFNLQL